MILKNNAARLITINHNGESYPILPGNNPAVDVPDAACGDYVGALISCGDLSKVGDSEPVKTDSDGEEEVMRQLLEEAGVEVDGRWGVRRLQAELDKLEK